MRLTQNEGAKWVTEAALQEKDLNRQWNHTKDIKHTWADVLAGALDWTCKLEGGGERPPQKPAEAEINFSHTLDKGGQNAIFATFHHSHFFLIG